MRVVVFWPSPLLFGAGSRTWTWLDLCAAVEILDISEVEKRGGRPGCRIFYLPIGYCVEMIL